MKPRIELTILACLALATAAQAQNWSSFRGPGASGIADGSPMPVEWNGETGDNILWKTAIPGLAHSSPIVWGDRIFVTTAVRHDGEIGFNYRDSRGTDQPTDDAVHDWRVYALDKHTGEILWERTARTGKPRSRRHGKSSQASPTPATNGVVVIAYFGSQGLYAYDLDGGLLWERDLGVLEAGSFFDKSLVYGITSSPVIYEDLVIVQADLWENSFLAAFRLSDGEEVWRVEREGLPSWGSPNLYRGLPGDELIVNGSDFVRAYDPRTGQELWRLFGSSKEAIPTPVVANDLIYVTSVAGGASPIFAIRPGGRGDISLPDNETASEAIAWSRKSGGVHVVTPLVYRNVIYLCSNVGIASSYDALTGERLYRARLSRSGAGHFASPVAADGKIYFANEDGDVVVVKAGPEFELLATNPMGEVVIATPAISEGVLFIRAMHHLFAVGNR